MDFLRCHRSGSCEHATFLIVDFGGFVVHPFSSLNPLVHYLNKQEEPGGGERDWLLLVYRVSLLLSFSIINVLPDVLPLFSLLLTLERSLETLQ